MTMWRPWVVYQKIKRDFYSEKPTSRIASFIGLTAMRQFRAVKLYKEKTEKRNVELVEC